MSTSSLTPRVKLTDLPFGLRSHILSFLCNKSRHPRISISLASAESRAIQLPQALLSVALASPHLAANVADLLGQRAVYLTANAARRQLPQWVSALALFVKAVSTWDPILEFLEPASLPHRLHQHFYDDLCIESVNLFKALAGDLLRLEVLDLRHVPFDKCPGKEDDLVQGLVAALESHNGTLRELALPVSDLCANALEMVSLRKLVVLSLGLRRVKANQRMICNKRDGGADTFMRLLRAVDGHADRSRKWTTLQELRLKNVCELPCRSIGDSGCSPTLFMAIRTLRIDVASGLSRQHYSDVKFISLFPNLEFLYWNGAATGSGLEEISRGCRKIQELHLGPSDGFIYARSMAHLDFPRIQHSLEGILEATQGRMRTLVLYRIVTLEEMRVIGEKNPVLENLKMTIGSESICGLSLLLGRHCRQMRGLHLLLHRNIENRMGDEAWGVLTEALKSASDTLCDVDIKSASTCDRHARGIEAMVRCMVDVLEFLGERARKVTFRVPVIGIDRIALVDAVNLILETCTTYTRGLEILKASFVKRVVHYSFLHDQQESESFAVLLQQKERLLAALPNLHSIDLGGLDKRGKEQDDDGMMMMVL